jgi:hypothetical protein
MSDSDPCPSPATYRRRWPGREPDYVCTEHADDSRLIAEACDPVPDAPELLEPLRGAIKRIPCACTEGRVQVINVQAAGP